MQALFANTQNLHWPQTKISTMPWGHAAHSFEGYTHTHTLLGKNGVDSAEPSPRPSLPNKHILEHSVPCCDNYILASFHFDSHKWLLKKMKGEPSRRNTRVTSMCQVDGQSSISTKLVSQNPQLQVFTLESRDGSRIRKRSM